MSNVVPITVRPNSEKEQYRRHQIVVTFVPATGKWRWEIDFTVTCLVSGEGISRNDAFRRARARLDKLLEA